MQNAPIIIHCLDLFYATQARDILRSSGLDVRVIGMGRLTPSQLEEINRQTTTDLNKRKNGQNPPLN